MGLKTNRQEKREDEAEKNKWFKRSNSVLGLPVKRHTSAVQKEEEEERWVWFGHCDFVQSVIEDFISTY